MSNASLFLSSFASYLLVYFVFIAVILIAVFIGVALRKNKNKKEELSYETISNGEKADGEV